MNRLDNLFNQKKSGILNIYFTAGYPALDDTEKILNGLSKPVKNLSFPYNMNKLNTAMNCINRLEQLGDYEFNWSYGRSLELAKKWTSPAGMRTVLHGFSENYRSGDIYVRWRVPRS